MRSTWMSNALPAFTAARRRSKNSAAIRRAAADLIRNRRHLFAVPPRPVDRPVSIESGADPLERPLFQCADLRSPDPQEAAFLRGLRSALRSFHHEFAKARRLRRAFFRDDDIGIVDLGQQPLEIRLLLAQELEVPLFHTATKDTCHQGSRRGIPARYF